MYQFLFKARPLKQTVLCKVTHHMSCAGKNQGSVSWLKHCNRSGWTGNYRKTLQSPPARNKEQPMRRGLLSSDSGIHCLLTSFKVWKLPWSSLETSGWWTQWRGWHCEFQFFPWVLCMLPPVCASRSEMVRGKCCLLGKTGSFTQFWLFPSTLQCERRGKDLTQNLCILVIEPWGRQT